MVRVNQSSTVFLSSSSEKCLGDHDPSGEQRSINSGSLKFNKGVRATSGGRKLREDKQIEWEDENYRETEDRLNNLERSTMEIMESQKQVVDTVVDLSKSLKCLESGIMNELRRIGAGCSSGGRGEEAGWKAKRGSDCTLTKKSHIPSTPVQLVKQRVAEGRGTRDRHICTDSGKDKDIRCHLVSSGTEQYRRSTKRGTKNITILVQEDEQRRKISRKSPQIREANSEMSSNLSDKADKCEVRKQTLRKASEGHRTKQAGRLSIYSQRMTEARRRAEGALKAKTREKFHNQKTVNSVIHDFLMNMTLPLESTRRQVVVKIKSQEANRSHILSMLPYMGIELEILNCYSALLTARGRRNCGTTSYRVWYLPGWSKEMVLESELTLDELYTSYLTEDKFGGMLWECEKICIPLNWDGNHWYLAAINLKAKKVMIFDPLPDSNVNELRLMNANVVCSKISGALYAGYGERFTYDFNDFEYSRADWCPRQTNKWDSGMFVMKYMELFDEMKEGMKIEIISNQARRNLAIELFVDASNEARQSCVDGFEGLQEIFLP